MMSKARAAVAIVVSLPDGSERFLTKVTRIRQGKEWKLLRVGTAWSLPGATLYQPEHQSLDKIVRLLAADGRTFRTVDVAMVES